MSAQLEGEWPYFRENPDCVVLDVATGVAPSGKPPVRIFLGTEEGQYRAERIFIYSVAKHRDPSRVYEIHLMKNVTGFDRRGWRTGFTCYRFAIPDFAGRQGKAIYNDVDQIYFTDPARLFDLPMDGHGYLAIDARDTSVMLIDCERMLPWWNRDAASRRGAKGPLTSTPAKMPGLWGQLDHHWNARDQEYVEGRTMCLHYTLLHQQPWNPSPEVYSYHENPLAHLWYRLEAEANAAAFEVFSAERPSPGFTAILGSNQPPAGEPAAGVDPLSPAARDLIQRTGSRRLLLVGLDGALTARLDEAPVEVARHDLAHGWTSLPEQRSDAVLAAGLFEAIPGADVNWVLRALFEAAGRALVVRIATSADQGVGSAAWWHRRIKLVADQYPEVSWQLDSFERLPTGRLEVSSRQARKVEPPAEPLIWLLPGGTAEENDELRRLAQAVGGRVAEQPVDGTALQAPWPDLVLLTGRRALRVAREAQAKSGGAARLVQLGRPGGSFAELDLIMARPDDRLPVRPNVLQLAAPLLAPAVPCTATAAESEGALAGLVRPVTALLLSGKLAPYSLGEASAKALGEAAAAEAKREGGSLLVCGDGSVPDKLLATLRQAAGPAARFVDAPAGEDTQRALLLAGADRFILAAGDAAALAETCPLGKPILLFDLPRWYDELPMVKPMARLLLPMLGGHTYRGTPLQQHAGGRFLDWLATRGLLYRARDLEALYRSLEGRGLLMRLGATERMAGRQPLDDLERAAERVRLLLREARQAA